MITLSRAYEICDNKLLGLEQDFQARAREWLAKMRQINCNVLIYCGYRSFDEQNKLYAKGRTEAGKIVTKARGGQSYHNYGLAFDYVGIRENPKNLGYYESDWDCDNTYRMGDAIGHALNIVPISWESGHLQDGRYKTFRDIPTKGSTRIMQSYADDMEPKEQQKGKKSFFGGWKTR